MTDENLEKLLGAEFADQLKIRMEDLPKPEPLVPRGVHVPECTFCETQAVYVLDKILIEIQTNEGARHVIETTIGDPNLMVYVCMVHKDSERDQEIAEGAHASIMQQTSVMSELVHHEVYWRIL